MKISSFGKEILSMNLKTFLVSFLILMNLLGFTAMYLDKQKARKRAFRIPEATLFKIALMGGSLGSILGMYTFRHKTRHASFIYGMPAIFLLQLLLLFFLYTVTITPPSAA